MMGLHDFQETIERTQAASGIEPSLSVEEKRALTAGSMQEPVYFEGRRVHVVGCQAEKAALWFFLRNEIDPTQSFCYDPVEYAETSWPVARSVLETTRVFLPDQVEMCWDRSLLQHPDEHHLLGVYQKGHGYLRFEREIDDATFHRLTRYNGLPNHWTAWHSGSPYAWQHARELPVITQGMWKRMHLGEDPEWDNNFLLPQDPVPLMQHYVAYYQAVRSLRVVPATIGEAKAYIRGFHRHNPTVTGGLFALAVADLQGTVRGVAIVGRPISRALDTGKAGERKRRIAEIVRLASDETFDVCSMLYGAARRMAKDAGFEKIITYTQQEESGASLRASGWVCVIETGGRQWDRTGRPRITKAIHDVAKYRWECDLNKPFPFEELFYPSGRETATPFLCASY